MDYYNGIIVKLLLNLIKQERIKSYVKENKCKLKHTIIDNQCIYCSFVENCILRKKIQSKFLKVQHQIFYN